MKNKTLLKSILASASAATIVLSSANAMAGAKVTQASPASLGSVGDWVGNIPPQQGDSIQLGGAHDVTFNAGADVGFDVYDLQANDGQKLTIADDNDYSITSFTRNVAETLSIDFVAAGTLTLTNTSSAINNVTFNDVDGTLIITAGNIAGKVDTLTTDNKGTLIINGITTVSGTIGETKKLKEVQIGAAGELTAGDINTAKIVFDTANSTLSIGAKTLKVTSTEGKGNFETTGAATLIGSLGQADEDHTLTKVTLGDNLTLGDAGAPEVAAIYATNIESSGVGDVRTVTVAHHSTVAGDATDDINFVINDGKTLTLAGGAFAGTINGVANPGNDITLNITGDVKANGLVGAANKLTLIDISHQDGKLTAGKDITATTLKFTADGGEVNLADNKFTGNVDFNGKAGTVKIGSENGGGTITGNVDTSAAGTGVLEVSGDANGKSVKNSTVTGEIGHTQSLSSIKIGDYAKLSAGDINTAKIVFDTANSTLSIGAKTLKVTSTEGKGNFETTGVATLIGSLGQADANNTLTLVTLGGDLTLGAGAEIYAATIGDGNAHKIIVSEDSKVKTTNSTAATSYQINDGKKLTLAGGEFEGAIDGQNNDQATLEITGKVTTAAIGAAHTLLEVQIGANADLTAGKDIIATTLKFTAAGSVDLGANKFTGDVDFDGKAGTVKIGSKNGGGTITGNVDTSAAGTGVLEVSGDANGKSVKNSTVTGEIGHTQSLSSIKIGDYAKLSAGDINTAKIVFDSANSTLSIGAKTLKVTSTEGKGNFETTGVATLIGSLGQADANNTLTLVTLGGDLTLGAVAAGGNPDMPAAIYATNIVSSGGAKTVTVVHDSTVAGDATDDINFVINDGKKLTLARGAFAGTINGVANPGNDITLNITGDVKANGLVGAANKLTLIDISHVDGKLTAGKDITATTLKFTADGSVNLANNTFTGNVDFNGKDGTLTLTSGKVDGAIDSNGAAGGKLVIYANAKVTGAIGASNPLTSIEIGAAGDFTAGADIKAATLKFGGAGKVDLGANKFTGDVNFGGFDGTVTVDELSKINGKIISGGSSAGILTLTKGGAISTDIGGVGASLKELNINSDAVNTDKTIYATNINITGGAFTVKSTATINSTDIRGAGKLKLEKAFDLSYVGAKANLAALELAGNATYEIKGTSDVTTTKLDDGSTLKVSANSELKGDLNTGKSVIELGTNKLTAAKLTLGADSKVKTTLSSTSFGKIEANTTAGGNLFLDIDDTGVRIIGGTDLQIFSQFSGGTVTINNINNKNNFEFSGGKLTSKYDPEAAAADATATTEAISRAVPTTFISPNNLVVIKELIENSNKLTGSVKQLAQSISVIALDTNLTEAQRSEKLADTAARAVSTSSSSLDKGAVGNATVSIAAPVLSARVESGANGGKAADFSSLDSGVAAGDESTSSKGVWVQGLGNQTKQKMRKSTIGYDSETYGAIAGMDGMLNDNLFAGIAAGFTDSKLKLKNFKKGDTVDSKAMLFSIYGSYNFDNNMYLRAATLVSRSNVKTHEKQVLVSTANGKYNSTSYGGEVATGYRHNIEWLTISPEAGVRAFAFNDSGYTEEGGYSRTVAKRAGNSVDGFVNLGITGNFESGDAVIRPSVRAGVEQQLSAKSPEVSMRLDGQVGSAFVSKSKSVNKTRYSAGADVFAQYGMMEYGAGYTGSFAPKFSSHTGTLKVKVNL